MLVAMKVGVYVLLFAAGSLVGCGDNHDAILDQEPIWTIRGNPCFGLGGTATGDLDGDGIADLVLGTPNCAILRIPGAVAPQIAIYRGTPDGFDPHPIVHTYVIENSAPFEIDVGDIDGDGRADLMMTAFGVSDLFLGTKDLETIFENPLPGAGGAGVFFDADGDGVEEFLVTDGATITVLDGKTLFAAGSFPGGALARAGDADGDGREDLYVRAGAAIQLYRGCKKSRCVGGLPEGPHAVPVTELPTAAGDVNGDGRDDAVVWSVSQAVTLHLADAQGILRERAEWTLRPDLLYSGFRAVRSLGDINGDGRPGDLGLSMQGRTDVLFASSKGLAAQPGWEWSLGSATDASYTFDELTPVMARDFDGDGFSDVVMLRTEQGLWNLVAYHGGRVPPGTTPPTLPTQQACRLRETATMPDISVDGELVRRSLRVRTESFGADACELVEKCIGAPGARRLLDFSVSIQNFGGAAALLPTPQHAPQLYQYDICHGHEHLIGFADYALLEPASDTVVVAGHKQGFYPTDSGSYCDRGSVAVAGGTTDFLYISPGWADIYGAGLQCQWIDITDIPDGTYRLRVRVNVSKVIDEDDQLPDEVEVPITIAGDRVSVAP